MNDFYWPLPGEVGTYEVCGGGATAVVQWDGSKFRFSNGDAVEVSTMKAWGYLGVRREAEKPTPTDDEKFAAFLKRAAAEVATWPEWMQDTLGWWRDEERAEKPANTHKPPRNALLPDPDDGNAMVAQQALDEWRAVKQAPKAADWAYKWAVTLCEIAGAR